MAEKVYIVVGLGYGDEGKGTIVDFITRQSDDTLIVRYNGGSQAAHNVVTPKGLHHTFSQFGSGMLVPNTRTYLSQYMLVNPLSLVNESEGLKKLGVDSPLPRMAIHKDALVTTPFHQAANRIKEAIYGEKLSGSCGRGIWETISDAEKFDYPLRIGDLLNEHQTIEKLRFNQFVKRIELSNLVKKSVIDDEEIQYELQLLHDLESIYICLERYQDFIKQVQVVDSDYLESSLQNSKQVIFEGAQGILLDVNCGFNPYTTWTDITPQNAKALLENYQSKIETVGILRSYTTRHGIGCFVSENNFLDIPEPHNRNNRWQKGFRIGYFDLVATKYSIKSATQIDFIAMTHLDYIGKLGNKICESYNYIGSNRESLPEFFELDKDEMIIGIKTPDSNEATRQKITALLFDCRPNLVEIKSNYIQYIENKLQTEIKIVSKGQTYLDKEWRKKKNEQ